MASKSRKRAASDDSDDVVSAKKAKAATPTFSAGADAKKDDEGNAFWEISKNRRVTISVFKGTTMVNIREHYERDGKTLPGKKGISMSIEQFSAVVSALPGIERELATQGASLPRPDYADNGAGGLVKDEQNGGGKEGDEALKRNFEATSDEEE